MPAIFSRKITIYPVITALYILFLLDCTGKIRYDYRDKNSRWYLSEHQVKILQDGILAKFYLPIDIDDHIIYARYSVEENTYKQHVIIYKIDFSGRKTFYLKSSNSNPLLQQEIKLSESDLDRINQLFYTYHFKNMPPLLPVTGANIQEPCFGVIVGFREKPGKGLKIIDADMTADRQYYPDGFFQFSYELEINLKN